MSKILHISGRQLLKIVIPAYKHLLTLKKNFHRFYSPLLKKDFIVHIFSRRFIVLIVLISISVFVVTSNLNAYEVKRDDFTYSNILVNLANKQDLGEIIETEGPIGDEKKITRYLGNYGVEIQPQLDQADIDQDLTPGTISSGGAIVKPILSPAETEIRKRDKIINYTVEPGDTVSYIAQKFGISINTILWENNLTSYSIIRPGQKLVILPISGIQHIVKKGENLKRIAEKYNSEFDDIIEYNKLASADNIRIGEKLFIPGGKKPRPTRTYSIRSIRPATSSSPPPASNDGKLLWPSICRRITQYYGWRHSGIDIACGYNNPVRAAANGRVIKAQGGWNGGYGIIVVIDHANGIQTLYAHLGKLYVRVGDTVIAGQSIAAEGSTGRSSGPHLHFEVRKSGWRKNPLSYL